MVEINVGAGGADKAETIEWETSENKIEARFWLLEKLC